MLAGLSCCSNHLSGVMGEDLFEVAGAWAEGEAVEELLGSFLLSERGELEGVLLRLGGLGFVDGFSSGRAMARWRQIRAIKSEKEFAHVTPLYG
jgi:hypothetical protein